MGNDSYNLVQLVFQTDLLSENGTGPTSVSGYTKTLSNLLYYIVMNT